MWTAGGFSRSLDSLCMRSEYKIAKNRSVNYLCIDQQWQHQVSICNFKQIWLSTKFPYVYLCYTNGFTASPSATIAPSALSARACGASPQRSSKHRHRRMPLLLLLLVLLRRNCCYHIIALYIVRFTQRYIRTDVACDCNSMIYPFYKRVSFKLLRHTQYAYILNAEQHMPWSGVCFTVSNV